MAILVDNTRMPALLRRFVLIFPILALFAAGVMACAVNPVSGERELALLSETDELRLGQNGDVDIRNQYGVYGDARLRAYVQQIGEQLAAHSHRSQLHYTFTILDTPDVNAFALPGGYIYITRGILAHLNSEAELAAVLGHEIGHVTARHAVRQYSAALGANVGITLTSILVPELANRSAQSLFGLIGSALLSGYGREHELEADHLGAVYLARTGYNPQAMLDVITLLKNQESFEKERALQEGREPRVYHGVFATHPSADQRLQQVVVQAENDRSSTSGRVERNSFLHRLDGLAYGDSEAQGIRRGNDFYHRGLNFTVHFPDHWRLDNSPEKLLGLSASGDAVIQMQAAARGKARTPQEYLVVQMQVHDLRNGMALTANGLSAYSGVTRMQTPFGLRDTPVAVVFLKQQAFRFFGAAREESPAFQRAFLDTVQSLRPLTATQQSLARGMRVDVRTAKRGESFARLASRAPLKHEPAAVLRLLNGKYPDGEPTAGELIKTIH